MRTEEEIRRYLVTYTVVLEAIHDNDEEFPDIDIERKTFELEVSFFEFFNAVACAVFNNFF